MTKHCNFFISDSTENSLIITDGGHMNNCPTVTNDVEWAIGLLHKAGSLKNRRLYYYDSQGDFAEILYDGDDFKGFRHALRSEVE